MGLKLKINLSLIAVVLVASLAIIFLSYQKSRTELTQAVDTGNLDLVHTVASEINTINEREFKMLDSLANLNVIRDPDVDMREKWELVMSAVAGNGKYFGLGFFNADGIGYATTGKWSDLHDREYLVVSMRGQKALMDPNWSAVNGHLCTFYAVPVKAPGGYQLAEISAVVDAGDLCKTVASINVGKNSHPFIMSMKTGKYVAHENEDYIKDGVAVEDTASEGLKALLPKIQSGITATEVFYDEVARAKYSIAYQPVPNTDWVAVCLAPYSDFYSGIGELLRTMILIGIIALLLAVVVGVVVVNLSLRPVKSVGSAIAGIAMGDADLTKRLDVKTNDELGHLATGFNSFSEKMRTIVSELKDTKLDLHTYGERLGTMVQDNANFITKMLGDIKNINAEIANQHVKVGSTVEAVGGISTAVEDLRKMLQTQEQGVAQASSAVTEMIGNIDSVSHSIEKMSGEFDVLQNDVSNGISRQHEVNEQIQQIEQQSKMLNEANIVISNIAEQTNLLAMNAAIEAAHAGEAGKGFAVVADEIRKLSETSSTQSRNIGTQLKAILTSISNVVLASDMSDKVFSGVMDKIKGTGDLVHQIKLAMDEQSEGSKQIGEALSYMNDATGQVRGASNDVDQARQGIIGDVESLRQSSDAMQDLVKTMEASVKHIEEDDDSLMNIATSINGSIYRIGSQIDQFKV